MHYESVLAALLIRLLFGWRTRDEVKAWNVSAVRLGVLAKKTPLPLSWDARTCKPCTKIPRSQDRKLPTRGRPVLFPTKLLVLRSWVRSRLSWPSATVTDRRRIRNVYTVYVRMHDTNTAATTIHRLAQCLIETRIDDVLYSAAPLDPRLNS
jgi:hypothetical protein